MQQFSLENRPDAKFMEMRKTATIHVAHITDPFVVETREGEMEISPEQCDDWDNGYWIAYPADGSKPYAISPEFMGKNYVNV